MSTKHFFIVILKNSIEDEQEGTKSIFLSCDGFAGLAALKSIKTFFFSLLKSADPAQNAQKDWLCGIKPCYYYSEIVPLQDRREKKDLRSAGLLHFSCGSLMLASLSNSCYFGHH